MRDGGPQVGACFRRESSGGMEWLGVWNGWGYGMAGGMALHFFRALIFQISEPEIWRKSLFLQNFKDFPRNIGL